MKLYCADCMDILKGIPEGSIDMILCDLPYGTTRNKIGIEKNPDYYKTAISRIKEAHDNGKRGNQKKQPDHD